MDEQQLYKRSADASRVASGVTTRPELEAVVFDAGGTLVRLDFEWMSEMLAGLGFPASVDDLRRAEVHGRRRYDALAGSTPKTLSLIHI